MGNLTERRDERASGGLTEHFYYDNLNRLDNSTLTTPVSGTFTNLDLSYDAAGNITSKQGVGSYYYESTRTHALTRLERPDGTTDTFTYDANGNLLLTENSTAGVGKTVNWTSYNYPSRVEQGGNVVTFKYGPNRQRYSEKIYSGGLLERHSITVNGHFEKVEEDGVVTYKHYIRAGTRVIAIHDRKSDGQHATHYLHRDHLGSVDTITDEDGNVETRTSFDAFGQRRVAANWNDGFPIDTELEAIRDITTRGYTGHQMVDAVNLIHMGGRIYDPELGRFLSPDPNVPDPHNTQAFNRYSYVFNNPLSLIDPSGFVPRRNRPVVSLGWSFGFSSSYDSGWRGDSAANYIRGEAASAVSMAIARATLGVLAAQSGLRQIMSGSNASTGYGNLAISDSERQMLKDGDLASFWRSRHERGDPWAEDGLALWDPDNPAVSDEARTAAALLKGKVYAAIVARDGEALSLNQFSVELRKIGIAIAKEHVAATIDLNGRVVGLSLGAQYHHAVFARFGLPPTTYGATLVEPAPWNGFWSYESQARFVNDYIYEYCKGCPD